MTSAKNFVDKNSFIESIKYYLLESMLQGLILGSGHVVIIGTDHNGIIRIINPGIRRVFGYLEGEVEGKELSALIPEIKLIEHKEIKEEQHAGDIEFFENNNRELEVIENRQTPPAECYYMDRFVGGSGQNGIKEEIPTKRKDGTPIWIELSIEKLLLNENYIYSVVIDDITARKEKEEETCAIKQEQLKLEQKAMWLEQEKLRLEQEKLQLEQEKALLSQNIQRESEAQSRKYKTIYQTQKEILNTSKAVIIKTNEEGVINLINPAVRKVFGYLEGEVEGEGLSHLIPELESIEYESIDSAPDSGELELFLDEDFEDEVDSDETEYNYLERFVYGQTGGKSKEEIQTRKKDGTPIWIELYISKILTDTNSIYSVFINDITERKRREKEAIQLEKEKVTMTQELLQVTQENNRTLEQKVQRRTAAIKELMDNTGQGFFSFGSDYKVHHQYSKACEQFFQKPIYDLDALELLFKDKIEQVKAVTDLLFNGIASLDQVEELLPKEIIQNKHTFSIVYRAIKRVEGECTTLRIMVILTDITQQKKLARQLEKDEILKELITKVAINRDDFSQCIRNILDTIEMMEKEDFQLSPHEIDVSKLFRWYHSIKGCTASFALKSVSDQAHQIETILEDCRNEPESFDQEMLQEIILNTVRLKHLLLESIESISDLISLEEIVDNQNITYKVPECKIQNLESILEQEEKLLDPNLIRNFLHNFRMQPIRKTMKKYAAYAKSLASDLGKQVEIELNGIETEIDYSQFGELFSELNHMIRNSIDHGIEDPETREAQNKPESGKLKISTQTQEGFLQLEVSDDGAGIDPNKIRAAAINKGILSEEVAQNLSDKAIFNVIFEPGFSSKEQVSSISGRGVGMDAVMAVVQELHGTIVVESVVGKGTTFKLTVPFETFSSNSTAAN